MQEVISINTLIIKFFREISILINKLKFKLFGIR